ncbi:complement C1q-like protein 3 [Mya arenaria]|uniref:complement C1q-like protein 3 n=1 Tax=Mya arenaria TaxID=6604 RepID=UPI0022E2E4D0|nr:complement C1q-like protein 3 [Mya arenaria]
MAQNEATQALMNHAMVEITKVQQLQMATITTKLMCTQQLFLIRPYMAMTIHGVIHLVTTDQRAVDKVLVNNGTGYSPNTGVFTCPEGGTYMFTFVIGQRDANHYMWAELGLNSANVIDAAVDTYHQYQDIQGRNTVILKLKQGDEVWVDATHSGSHVEGSTTLRLSSFTGLYLYSK